MKTFWKRTVSDESVLNFCVIWILALALVLTAMIARATGAWHSKPVVEQFEPAAQSHGDTK